MTSLDALHTLRIHRCDWIISGWRLFWRQKKNSKSIVISHLCHRNMFAIDRQPHDKQPSMEQIAGGNWTLFDRKALSRLWWMLPCSFQRMTSGHWTHYLVSWNSSRLFAEWQLKTSKKIAPIHSVPCMPSVCARVCVCVLSRWRWYCYNSYMFYAYSCMQCVRHHMCIENATDKHKNLSTSGHWRCLSIHPLRRVKERQSDWK